MNGVVTDCSACNVNCSPCWFLLLWQHEWVPVQAYARAATGRRIVPQHLVARESAAEAIRSNQPVKNRSKTFFIPCIRWKFEKLAQNGKFDAQAQSKFNRGKSLKNSCYFSCYLIWESSMAFSQKLECNFFLRLYTLFLHFTSFNFKDTLIFKKKACYFFEKVSMKSSMKLFFRYWKFVGKSAKIFTCEESPNKKIQRTTYATTTHHT